MTYRDAAGAYEDAQAIRKDRALKLEADIEEPAGSEVVLELSVGDVPFHVGLLFRIVGRFEGQTMLEWWPRRSTDNRLLDLWLQSLESRREDAAREKDDIDHEALQEAMELYRRCLATNPFDVLGLHWTATEPVIAEAKASLTAEVNKRLKKAGDNEEMRQYLAPCVERVSEAADVLSQLDGRLAWRARVVPEREATTARKQAEYLAQLADRAGKEDQAEQARMLIAELNF